MSRRDESRTCAACRYSRMKCSPECPLAAYFPVAGNQDFQDLIRMYHPTHIKETLLLLKNKHDRDAAVRTMILQARHHRHQSAAAGIVAEQLPDYVPGPGPIPVPGSGLDMDPLIWFESSSGGDMADEFALWFGSGQEMEALRGFGSPSSGSQ